MNFEMNFCLENQADVVKYISFKYALICAKRCKYDHSNIPEICLL